MIVLSKNSNHFSLEGMVLQLRRIKGIADLLPTTPAIDLALPFTELSLPKDFSGPRWALKRR